MLMNRTTPFMVPVDEENPAIIKDEALCSQCGHCFAICEEEIGVAAKYLLNPRRNLSMYRLWTVQRKLSGKSSYWQATL